MKQPTFLSIQPWAGPLAVLALAIYGAPVLAARPPIQVSGTVTAVEGRQIVVDGISYPVQLQGAALQQLGQIRVGTRVDVVLSGPRGATATQVTTIRTHNGP
jgi:hypothetical protein